MKGCTLLRQEEVRREGGEEKKAEIKEHSWVTAVVHHFRGAVNGQKPLLC